ncbi:ABC transporter ATP-binding protein [Sulfurovum sp. bin170]|uniref:ABC transporter ATP-binding protein n=1 Tax=Sulfurovum sp. bin170 TaxID=2695268 RepID=UPI0013DF8DA6|nr:ABC transporter ATP-binding protein [Sulfurovum sp. bin170]NEW60324.1 ABC transporter ATP-binding protein [Sulfurovum sp. bin170]
MNRVEFINVTKKYKLLNTSGIKELLFNPIKIVKEYRENQFMALERVSFEIKDGDVVGIVGRNGAGKSTMLGLMAGVLFPTEGKIEVNGKIAPLLELGAGFHPDLSGRENIVLNGILLGMSRKEMLSNIDSIIEFSELKEFIEQPIRIYSSGMLSRLGFSIAVHTNPDILLIDEVLSVGDRSFQKRSEDKIYEFKKMRKTIIFVSHDFELVKKLCSKMIIVENHKILYNGGIEDGEKMYNEII